MMMRAYFFGEISLRKKPLFIKRRQSRYELIQKFKIENNFEEVVLPFEPNVVSLEEVINFLREISNIGTIS